MTASAISRPGERDRLPVKLGQIDWRLAGLIALIGGAGAMMLYSVAGESWAPWAGNHLIRFGAVFVVMLGLALVDIRWWYAAAYPLYAVGLLLLIAVELFGETRMGATRWLDLGFTSLQPSEIMKLGIVLALARWYHGASAQEAKWHWKLIIPALMIAVPVVLVAHQPDLGTSLLILFTGVAIMFAAGLSWRIVLTGIAGIMVVAPMMYFFVLHDYQRARVDVLLNPEADPSGAGYHIAQAKIAIGSGGLLGKGYGLGSQSQLNFLPEKHTDFIFPTLAEEFGFLGAFFILAIYGAIIAISLRIASLSHNHFGRLAAAGVTATFALYVLINGAMVMGLAPVVGVPMPLLSYGGTVMLTVMIGFGLIQSVRVHRYLELPKSRGVI
ncbi:rod shape-determining protein RodA [Brevundimonas aveniformis]|uniref:rod shape-determining protein RodA n=1 Tax=Brevundimonas aveniformis TaxID=370977 RepID=UPI0003F5208E|nr:rod shape-determining protein RodA [Brevundimonas aveniformis]